MFSLKSVSVDNIVGGLGNTCQTFSQAQEREVLNSHNSCANIHFHCHHWHSGHDCGSVASAAVEVRDFVFTLEGTVTHHKKKKKEAVNENTAA